MPSLQDKVWEGKHTLISSKVNMRILEKLRANHVAKSVILLIDGEDGRVWGTCIR